MHKTTLRIKVIPRSSLNKIIGSIEDGLKIKLTALAVDGKANKALINFLSEVLGVPKRSVSIVSGCLSRNKLVNIAGLSLGNATKRLLLAKNNK